MILPPPTDDEEPISYDEGPTEFTREQYEYIKSRLDKPSWTCSCGLVNNYYNRSCARCKSEKR